MIVISYGKRRTSRRDFLTRWFGGTLLGFSGSIFGAVAAYEAYVRWSQSRLHRLNAGTAARYYPNHQPSSSTPAPPVKGGEEPALFVATAPAIVASPPPTKPLSISIASIELETECVELITHIVDGEMVWKTADHAVGHHVGTAMPGETGNCVMSGHISSPLSHEGNVFHRLPELADKLASDVEIVMEGGRHIHYRIVGTQVVTPSDVWVMNPTPTPVLTLLTCVPDGVYTHRLVVTGTLTT